MLSNAAPSFSAWKLHVIDGISNGSKQSHPGDIGLNHKRRSCSYKIKIKISLFHLTFCYSYLDIHTSYNPNCGHTIQRIQVCATKLIRWSKRVGLENGSSTPTNIDISGGTLAILKITIKLNKKLLNVID